MRPEAGLLLAALSPSLFAQAPGPVPQQPAPVAPAPAPDVWVPRPVIEIAVLDKVSARATALSGKVGQELHLGSLTIVAKSCMVRPPGAAPDAAAYLEITDGRPGTAPFHGWMLLRSPAVSVYEHPVYDVRLIGCRAA